MEFMILIFALLFCLILLVTRWVTRWLASPFVYPQFIYDFDASGMRLPKMENFIDEFLIDGGMDEVMRHLDVIAKWKADSEQLVAKSMLRKRRQRQYNEACVHEADAFLFIMWRNQTRYHQCNYQRSAYTVRNEIERFSCDYAYLMDRDRRLYEIGYETTLEKYHSKTQRKLMTPELRLQIKVRDNYTCQMCGKYMPDEVGLHIDHIVPVSKGGKTVPSNLQVLCDKCNRSKSNKIRE